MTSPKISIVVSVDKNNGIGKGNLMAWHIKKDLIHFKELTKNKVVIIGENTFKSMDYYYTKSGRQMPAKLYLVLTHDKKLTTNRPNVKFVYSLDEALKISEESAEKEIFIAGGANVFKETIGLTDRIYLTQIHQNFDCDTFFPDYSNFNKVISEVEDSEEGSTFTFIVLERDLSSNLHKILL